MRQSPSLIDHERKKLRWAHLLPEAYTGISFVDVNGDGRPDALVNRIHEDGTREVHAYINNPNDPDHGWVDTPQWDPPVPLTEDKKGDLGERFIDLNGDGLTDIIEAYRRADGTVVHDAWLNTGSGWKESPEYAALPPDLAFAGDFRPVDPDNPSQTVNAQDYGQWQKNVISRDNAVLVTDINGDGLPDIVYNYQVLESEAIPLPHPKHFPGLFRIQMKANLKTVSGALINTGHGWRAAPEYIPPKRLDTPWGTKTQYCELQDLNGDGLPDLAYVQYGQDHVNQSSAYLNTGKGWEPQPSPSWRIPDAAFQADAVDKDGKGDHGIRFMDLNGDGLVDLVQSYRASNNQIVSRAWLNDGTKWVENGDYIPKAQDGTLFPFADKSGEDTGVRPVDLNGDLIDDLIIWKKNPDGSDDRDAILNQSRRRDLLMGVTDGMGTTINFNYRMLTRGLEADGSPTDDPYGGFYTPASPGSYPIFSAPPPANAVESVSVMQNGAQQLQSLRYRYGGFRVNSRSRSPLGFAWREQINENTGMTERTDLSQTDSPYLVGSTLEHSVRYNAGFSAPTSSNPTPGALQSQVVNKWKVNVLNCSPIVDGRAYQRAQLFLDSTLSTINDLDGSALGTESDSFQYNDFGDALKVITERSDGSKSETTSEFTDDTDQDKWYLGRLTKATARLSNHDSSQVRTTTFAYDANGLLNREVSFAGTPKAVSVTYQHDTFGNSTFTTTTAAGIPQRFAEARFDNLGRFPIETKNALGQKSSATYDPVFGNILSATDPNGLTVRSEYDSNGMMAVQISPTGIRAITQSHFLDHPIELGAGDYLSYAVSETVSKVGTLPATSTWFDCQGLPLRTFSTGDDGHRILQDTEYDSFKRPYRVSIPYFEGAKPEQISWTQTSYDVTDRPTKILTPDGGATRMEYKGLTTTVIDKLQRKTETVYNLRKLPVQVTDPGGGVLRYFYDVGDRLEKIVRPDGEAIRYVYDQFGQRIGTFDPDLGHWQYRYDALGELTWQQDAKAQVTTIQYDLLGRPIQKDEEDRWTQWKYDSSKNAIGRLASMESSDGYAEEYSYDSFGRLIGTHTNTGDEKFDSATEYDAYNRAVALTYPTGFKVRNEYDASGFMRSVINDKTSEPYWKGLSYDQFGNVTRESFGNGVTTARKYNSSTGYLEAITAKNAQGDSIQRLQYSYDLAGNVTSRNDRVEKQREVFEYDPLDRLTSTSLNGRLFEWQTYNSNNSIHAKSGEGIYHYGDGGSGGPADAVVFVENHGKQDARYTYDANGNLMSSPSVLRAVYSASNLTLSLTARAGGVSQFKYTPNGAKYWEETSDGMSLVKTLDVGLYERVEESATPPWFLTNERLRQRYFIDSPSGVCAIAEETTEYFPVRHSPQLHLVDLRGGDEPERTTRRTSNVVYVHQDALGTFSAFTDEDGRVIERLDFDPWGKRIENGKPRVSPDVCKAGFTGQERLDGLGLIHMGGRIYDPNLGMFTRPDPYTHALAAPNLNRYSYVFNNPLKFTDPTGYSLFGDIWHAVTAPITAAGNGITAAAKWVGQNVLAPAGKFIVDNWKPIVVIAAAVVVSVVTFGAAAPEAGTFAAAVLAGAASGAAAGGLSVALNGGSLSDVLAGMIQGGVIGAFSGALMGGAGLMTAGWGWEGQAAAYGVTGGVNNLIRGGDFWLGFASGAAGNLINVDLRGFDDSMVLQTGCSAIVGGTISVIGGGKFANGASQAAFATLVSEASSSPDTSESASETASETSETEAPTSEQNRLLAGTADQPFTSPPGGPLDSSEDPLAFASTNASSQDVQNSCTNNEFSSQGVQSSCITAAPLPSNSPVCLNYGTETLSTTLFGVNVNTPIGLQCFCQCAGDSDWSEQVRGCLACEHDNGTDVGGAHWECYGAAGWTSAPWSTLIPCAIKCAW